ncbi:hypothetical protein RvY_06040 [Ramazzottius varieornatus]|uniref:Uncharacterized protein n=1 Tax=Ramazzottius varieornatus TaxID=947166 RepID=A0A1D1V5Z8_RAMVA|nr:hypothetical protein RvY_06040 [Ramazzottius varieornatus]
MVGIFCVGIAKTISVKSERIDFGLQQKSAFEALHGHLGVYIGLPAGKQSVQSIQFGMSYCICLIHPGM